MNAVEVLEQSNRRVRPGVERLVKEKVEILSVMVLGVDEDYI